MLDMFELCLVYPKVKKGLLASNYSVSGCEELEVSKQQQLVISCYHLIVASKFLKTALCIFTLEIQAAWHAATWRTIASLGPTSPSPLDHGVRKFTSNYLRS